MNNGLRPFSGPLPAPIHGRAGIERWRSYNAYDAGSAGHNSLQYAYDSAVLSDALGRTVFVAGATGTLDLTRTSVGVNGRDTDSGAWTGWQYLYLVADNTGRAGFVLSENSIRPDLHGYPYSALAGVLYNTNSKAAPKFRPCVIRGKIVEAQWVTFINSVAIDNAYKQLSAYYGTEYAALQTAVPPIAAAWNGMAYSATGAALYIYSIQYGDGSNDIGTGTIVPSFGRFRVTVDPFDPAGGVLPNFTIYGDTEQWSVYVTGFELP